jgi:SAM-dependent MidA family methyltransferase
MPTAECRKGLQSQWSQTVRADPFGIRQSSFGIDVPLKDIVLEQIRTDGPITAAAFIELALYHPEYGYYSRAGRRSGRGGDFYTSVDVGPLFGELLAVQIAECFDYLDVDPVDLVEAAAGDGRLARDVLDALERERPDLYQRTRMTLVERSHTATGAQAQTLQHHARQLADPRSESSIRSELPGGTVGVVYANELLDALPVHVVVMRREGLKEIFVGDENGTLVEIEGAPSTPALQAYLDRGGIALEPGGRAEINLAADDWMATAARNIERGFLILIDYGHEARELFSGSHATGTLTTFARHRAASRTSEWLHDPGERDITSHVDLTAVRQSAERAGFTTLGITDQTYFLLGVGLLERAGAERTNQAKTLMLPGGLGSTHKVMIFGKDVGQPGLKGLSYRVRVT